MTSRRCPEHPQVALEPDGNCFTCGWDGGPKSDDEKPPDRFPRIDWHTAYATDFSQIDWLPGRLGERGQQIAIVGDGKVGKTLLVHDWLARAVTGRSFLGDERRPPIRVLYFDRENALRDIVTRMKSFGATVDALDERFDYRLFPRFSGGLDAAREAAVEMLEVVDESRPDIVVLDTVSRFIAGKENDSDTWLQLYARVHAPLKARNVAGVRLDHMGKDAERGSRGSSAKSQDVDHVWELTLAGNARRFDPQTQVETITTNLKLNRTHTRTGLGEDQFLITRVGRRQRNGMWLPGGSGHELTSAAAEPGVPAVEGTTAWLVEELNRNGIPADWGARKVAEACGRLGLRAGKAKIEEAVRLRKAGTVTNVPRNVPYPPVTKMYPEDQAGNHVSAGQTSPGYTQGTYPDPPNGPTSPRLPSREGGRRPGHPNGAHILGHPSQDGDWLRTDTKPTCAHCDYPLDLMLVASGETTHPGCEAA